MNEPWRRYYVVCTEGARKYWWDRFLRPGYRHCYVLIWEGAVWLWVEPTIRRTTVAILDWYDERSPAYWVDDPAARIFQAWPEELRDGQMRAPFIWGPVTCVEGVKALLGIRSFWLWTPWQLAQHLRKRRREHEGGKEAERDGGRKGSEGGPDSRGVAAGGRDQRAQAADTAGAVQQPGLAVVGR